MNQKKEVIGYYTEDGNIYCVDMELIRPGEGEVIAAKRLLERVLQRYGRFIDGVIGDALYLESVYKLPIFSMSQRDECAGSDKLSISYIQERLQ